MKLIKFSILSFVFTGSLVHGMQQLPPLIQQGLTHARTTNQLILSRINLSALTDDQFHLLMDSIEQLPQLDQISVVMCHIDRLSTHEPRWNMFNHMLQHTRITRLHISGNNLCRIPDNAMLMLANTFTLMPALEELKIDVNDLYRMGDAKLAVFAHALSNMHQLRSLYLGTNGIGRLAGERLNILFSNIALIPQLELLNLDLNNIGSLSDENRTLLFSRLQTSQTLRHLDLVENDFAEMTNTEFANAIQALHLLPPTVFFRFGGLQPERIALLHTHNLALR